MSHTSVIRYSLYPEQPPGNDKQSFIVLVNFPLLYYLRYRASDQRIMELGKDTKVRMLVWENRWRKYYFRVNTSPLIMKAQCKAHSSVTTWPCDDDGRIELRKGGHSCSWRHWDPWTWFWNTQIYLVPSSLCFTLSMNLLPLGLFQKKHSLSIVNVLSLGTNVPKNDLEGMLPRWLEGLTGKE